MLQTVLSAVRTRAVWCSLSNLEKYVPRSSTSPKIAAGHSCSRLVRSPFPIVAPELLSHRAGVRRRMGLAHRLLPSSSSPFVGAGVQPGPVFRASRKPAPRCGSSSSPCGVARGLRRPSIPADSRPTYTAPRRMGVRLAPTAHDHRTHRTRRSRGDPEHSCEFGLGDTRELAHPSRCPGPRCSPKFGEGNKVEWRSAIRS